MNPAWIIKDDRPSVRLMRGYNCALLFGALVANLTHPALAQDCAADLGKLQGTYSSGDVGVIAAAATAFRDAGTCNSETERQALSQASARFAQMAQGAVAAGNLDDADQILANARAIHWAVLAVRADIAAKRGDRIEAATLYNSALDTIIDPNLTPQNDALIPIAERITQLAQENVMLAGTLSSTVTRGGDASGVLKAAMRGISIEPANTASAQGAPQTQQSSNSSDDTPPAKESVAYGAAKAMTAVYLPIRFATGSAVLDANGVYEAENIANFLRQNEIKKITLTGHTDDVGSDQFNLNLSVQRARSVQTFLWGKGVSTEIHIDGKGESHPPNLVDPTIYSLEERRAIARRVELVIQS